MYESDEVFCLDPVLIVNPALPSLLSKYHVLMEDGQRRYFRNSFNVYHFFRTGYFHPARNAVTYDNYKNYVVLDESTGESFPVYLLVPCNHCDLCKKNKLDSFAHRCLLESQTYTCLPWFLTLTYNNTHRPLDGLHVEHVQGFMKRFRISLERAGYDRNIRVTYCGEYSPSGRPHYHMIVWNLRPHGDLGYRDIMAIVTKCWSFGFVYNEIVNPFRKDGLYRNPDKCFEYVAKYIDKDKTDLPQFVDEDDNLRPCNPTFLCSSNRGGGIGAPFLDKYVIPTIRKTLNPGFKFLDLFSAGNVRDLYFYRYVLNRCFPTFSQLVPLAYRKAYVDLCLKFSYLDLSYRSDEVYAILRDNSRFLPTYVQSSRFLSGYVQDWITGCPAARLFLQSSVDEDIAIIRSFHDKIDLESAERLSLLRPLFVGKMLLNRRPRDLSSIAYNFRRARDIQNKTLVYDL